MSEKEVLKIYDRSRPLEEDLFDSSNVNHVAWTLAVLFGLIAVWLSIALVNAENQRYALMTNKCPDPVFNTGIDKACLVTVRSRDHWWEHWWYGATHVTPETPKGKR
jgi:hypothetical protein